MNDKISDDVLSIEEQIEKAIARTTLKLHSDLIKVAPVGTPESTGIKGYVGGSFKADWKVKKKFQMEWEITNNMEYASFLWRGHSKQWNGGDSMLLKANIQLENKFKRIKA